MRLLGRLAALGLLSFLPAATGKEARSVVPLPGDPKSYDYPTPDVTVSTSFPGSELFGVKIVNGRPTKAVLDFQNRAGEGLVLKYIGGALTTVGGPGEAPRMLRNLSSIKFDKIIPARNNRTFNYQFTIPEMTPQDVRMSLAGVVVTQEWHIFTVIAFNETISIVEASSGFFDPKNLFLYLVLVAAFGGGSYFVYRTWLSAFFPQQKKRGGGKSDRAKQTSKGESVSQTEMVEGESTATATGSKGYDESWIPDHHIQRPGAKKGKSGTPSGTPKTKART